MDTSAVQRTWSQGNATADPSASCADKSDTMPGQENAPSEGILHCHWQDLQEHEIRWCKKHRGPWWVGGGNPQGANPPVDRSGERAAEGEAETEAPFQRVKRKGPRARRLLPGVPAPRALDNIEGLMAEGRCRADIKMKMRAPPPRRGPDHGSRSGLGQPPHHRPKARRSCPARKHGGLGNGMV